MKNLILLIIFSVQSFVFGQYILSCGSGVAGNSEWCSGDGYGCAINDYCSPENYDDYYGLGVICCADEPIDAWVLCPADDVYSSRLTCVSTSSHSEAVGYCESYGGRLCTEEELQLGCGACSTGCGFDGQLVWTSTSCSSPGCNDIDACNYDSDVNYDDGSCWYAEEDYDCDGICIDDEDADGICDDDDDDVDGDGILNECQDAYYEGLSIGALSGDANGDGESNILDIVFYIEQIFAE